MYIVFILKCQKELPNCLRIAETSVVQLRIAETNVVQICLRIAETSVVQICLRIAETSVVQICLRIAETSVVQIVFNGVLYYVNTYTIDVFERRST